MTGSGPEAVVSAILRAQRPCAFDNRFLLSRRVSARSASATDQFTVAAVLISEADRSVTLAKPCHPPWRPGVHSTATTKITLCKSMRNHRAGRLSITRKRVVRTHDLLQRLPASAAGPAGSACAASGPSASRSRSRTRDITRRVSSVIRAVAARCSAPSVVSRPSSCVSARSAASGLLSWCWIRTIAFCNSLFDGARGVSSSASFVAAPSGLSEEDDFCDGSVTTDAARVWTIVSI